MRATWVLTVCSADDERVGDLGVRQAPRDQPQHLRSREVRTRRARRLGGRRAGGEALDQPRVTDGREQRAAVRDHADRGDQLLLGRVLEQEAARPGAQRLVDVLVEVERGQHEHPRTPVRRRRGSAGSPRCRPCRASGRPSARRRGPARGRARPPRRRRRPRRRPRCPARSRIIRKPGAHQRLVVGEQDADHRGSSGSTRADRVAALVTGRRRRRRRARPARACRPGRARPAAVAGPAPSSTTSTSSASGS